MKGAEGLEAEMLAFAASIDERERVPTAEELQAMRTLVTRGLVIETQFGAHRTWYTATTLGRVVLAASRGSRP